MAQVNAYLTYNGNCEEAFTFYKLAFGVEFSYIGKFKDMPPMEGKTMSETDGEKVMHVSLPISKETTIFGSDANEEYGGIPIIGNNISLSINAESEAEADKLFKALSAGGKITMPLEKTFWDAYFGMFTDKFGINWMINYDYIKA